MADKNKNDSPLVRAVLALDNHLSELERIGNKINSMNLSADFDLDHVQKLMNRFSECGQGITEEVANLSVSLADAQARAESVAEGVSRQSEIFNVRREEQNVKLEEFRLLGEKVRALNTDLSRFRPPEGQHFSDDERATLRTELPVVNSRLIALIEELQSLQASARNSKMRALEKNAESLAQTLEAVRRRLEF